MELDPSGRRVGLEEAQTFREHLKQNRLSRYVAYGTFAVGSVGVGLVGIENFDNLSGANSEQQVVYDQEALAYIDSINDNILAAPVVVTQPQIIAKPLEEPSQETIPTPPITEPIQTTMTTLPTVETTLPKKDCPDLVDEMRSLVPMPEEGRWQIVCREPNRLYDGMTHSGKRLIEIFFRDANDTDDEIRATIAHEIAHAWQFTLGMVPYNATRQEVRKLEQQADDFACAFGYCFPGTNKQRAAIACMEFAQHGADICPDDIG